METHTFDEWKKLGYRIHKGAKSESRNAQGLALFTSQQVYLPAQSYSRSSRRASDPDWDSNPGYSDLTIGDFQF